MGEREVPKPHDRLFKLLLDQPGAAETLLRERLSPQLAAQLVPAPPEWVNGTYVDEELRGTRSDRLYRVRLREPGQEPLLCIVEHKSADDPATLFQLLGYFSNLWSRLAQERAGRKPVSAITALVVYHGREAWKTPLSFGACVAVPAALKGEHLDFKIHLADFGTLADPDLSSHAGLRAGFMALKYASRPAKQASALPRIIQAMAGVPSLQYPLLRYLDATFGIGRKALVQAVTRYGRGMEDAMKTIADEYREEGSAKGKREWLLLQLEQKFGPLSQTRRVQVADASLDKLDRWFVRVLEAGNLESVLD